MKYFLFPILLLALSCRPVERPQIYIISLNRYEVNDEATWLLQYSVNSKIQYANFIADDCSAYIEWLKTIGDVQGWE